MFETRLAGKKKVAMTFLKSTSECNSLNFRSTKSRITNQPLKWIYTAILVCVYVATETLIRIEGD